MHIGYLVTGFVQGLSCGYASLETHCVLIQQKQIKLGFNGYVWVGQTSKTWQWENRRGWGCLHFEDDKKESREYCRLTLWDRGPGPDQPLQESHQVPPSQEPLFHANDIILRNLWADKTHNGRKKSNTGSWGYYPLGEGGVWEQLAQKAEWDHSYFII